MTVDTSLALILLCLFLCQLGRAMFLRWRGYPFADSIVFSVVWLAGAVVILVHRAVTL
jgi:hypothetical protein